MKVSIGNFMQHTLTSTEKMHLKKAEKQLLWRKYTDKGLSSEEANKKISDFVAYLNRIHAKLICENKSKKDINKAFKEEFWKICQKAEI